MTNREIDIRHFVFLLPADCTEVSDSSSAVAAAPALRPRGATPNRPGQDVRSEEAFGETRTLPLTNAIRYRKHVR
ncbi:MAG: hypothetical protein DME61_08600 [Verrucomicrobia bacterium]|nr:MAG: hypothetical protein DME61_08600 [Verrucomicrobiota bacterium]